LGAFDKNAKEDIKELNFCALLLKSAKYSLLGVGFEPTRLAPMHLKCIPLDRSGIPAKNTLALLLKSAKNKMKYNFTITKYSNSLSRFTVFALFYNKLLILKNLN
jgi:hypothetical protein